MSRIRLNVVIHAPKERVFQILTDIEGFASLQPSITAIQLTTPGPTRVGTAWDLTRRMLDKEATKKLYVSELEAPDKLVIKGEGSGVSYKTCYKLTDQNSGTLVEMDLEGTSHGFVASLMDKMTSASLKDCLEDDLAILKQAAENGLAATKA